MTQTTTKPWSQLDDELDECKDIAPAAVNDACSTDQGVAERGSSGLMRGMAGNPHLLRAVPYAALVPTAVAAGWTFWGAIHPTSGRLELSGSNAIGILTLLVVSGVLIVYAQMARRSALAALQHAITKSGRVPDELSRSPMAAELQSIWETTQRHTAHIEQRVAELIEERQELALELSLAHTQRRQAEAILDSISDPVLVTDAFDRLVLANPAAEKLFGFTRAEAQRRTIADVVTDDKLVRIIRQTREAAGRAAKRRTEHEMLGRAYAVTLSPVTSDPDSSAGATEHHGVVVVLRDITKARKASQDKSEFVSRVAHELRTPLSSIRAYVEMLVDGEAADDQTREEYYNIIQGSADRLGRLIDNMLNISRIEAGTVRINKEPVAVSVVVKEATDMMRPQAQEKDITLTEELPPVAYRIMADRDMIYQSILNLLSNAIKYTPEGGKVHVRVSPQEEDRTVRITVSDTGVGIPKEDLPRMFEKFFRVETNKKMAQGTGLGLNLVRHIVETVHDGKMTLESEEGHGSTFGIVLPLTV